jgi:cell division protein FtsI (penicillin-binding protein 3)|tara:strand:+ start:194 stop:562 length:369 start_codon:yes stop_codon:yes gene_type:complete
LSEPPQGIPAIEPSVANDLLEILETSVGAYTGGRRARVEGYRVGGKTGTVRKTGQQGYANDAYRSVFAGIAPISDPRIVTVVMIDHPKAGEFYGGAVAAPVFSSVTGNALRLLDVPPDYEVE